MDEMNAARYTDDNEFSIKGIIKDPNTVLIMHALKKSGSLLGLVVEKKNT